MSSTTVSILTFARPENPPNGDGKETNIDYQGVGANIWVGECIEDPGLTIVVVAGSSEFDTTSCFGLTPKQQQCVELTTVPLITCLSAPVTEVGRTILKADCDHAHATSMIDAAMQTVLDAQDCTGAAWKTSGDDNKLVFFVGWNYLEAHEKYHQELFANMPDSIKELPSIIDTSAVYHATFKLVHGEAIPQVNEKL